MTLDVEAWERLDLLWAKRSRPPRTRREWADALLWRAGVLDGYPSLLTANMIVSRTLPEHAEVRSLIEGIAARYGVTLTRKAQQTSVHEALTGSASVPRPPGLSDDHPLVRSGVYA